MLTRHNHIQNLVQRFHMQKADLLGILEYSEPFHNCIPTHIQNPVIFTKIYEYSEFWHVKTDTYSELSQRFKMDFFPKIVKNYNYFSKAIHLKSCNQVLNKYWLINFVEWPHAMYYIMHVQKPVYYRKFRHRGIFTSYLVIDLIMSLP